MDMTNATTTVSKNESKNCPIEENTAAIFSVGVLILVSVSYMVWADKIWYRYGESNPVYRMKTCCPRPLDDSGITLRILL